ncbi:hypothetical protein BB558_000445 [Smittium angustum]|uniref:Major facilitator superfamily (MFS) profile domain-containing protein n=1 Tax=Smittium angustum TaxID=133377 RepID=A0A2U1JE72_SMIAN|nr:hypothetical protein BB558_000445 [Smittium angustum]
MFLRRLFSENAFFLNMNNSDKQSIQNMSPQDLESPEKGQFNHEITLVLRQKKINLALIILIATSITSNINQTLVSSSFPAIGNHFNALNNVFWISLGYATVSATSQPFYYPLIAIMGVKRFYFACWILLAAPTILCIIGKNIWYVVFGYALSSFGGIGVSTCVSIIILSAAPVSKHKFFYGISSIVRSIGNMVGPLFGATIVSKFTFRSVFILEMIFIVACFLVSVYILHGADDTKTKVSTWKQFDILGSIFLVISIPCLIILFNSITPGSIFGRSATISCAIIFLVCFGLFIFNEKKTKSFPIIPTELYKIRSMILAYASVFLLGPRFVGSGYFIPMFSNATKNLSSVKIGFIVTTFQAGGALFGLLFYKFVKASNMRPYMMGMYVFVLSPSIYECFLNRNTPTWSLFLCEAIAGFGISGISLSATIFIIANSPKKFRERYLSLFSFVITMGAALSSALMILIYSNVLKSKINAIRINFPLNQQDINNALLNSQNIHSSTIPTDLSHALMDAYSRSIASVMIYDAVFVFVGLFLIYWTSDKNFEEIIIE